ncbi:UPF0394 membrane protein [Yarrowia sp. B02]|nr:UPF0394 membrane protein [Yarrowia sp. B02]
MFTPLKAICGAVMLHMATDNYLFTNGRILGASNILFTGLQQLITDPAEAIASSNSLHVLFGMFLAGLSTFLFTPIFLPNYEAHAPWAPFGSWTNLIAGLLVGFGTKLGSGCTSGHMLCGIARGSKRSFVATCTFSVFAMATARIVGSLPTCYDTAGNEVACHNIAENYSAEIPYLAGLLGVIIVLRNVIPKLTSLPASTRATMSSVFSGFAFGTGLLVSGLAAPQKTLGFLAGIPPKFDPSLAMVMLFGVLPNAISVWKSGFFKNVTPLLSTEFSLPQIFDVTPRLIIGAAIFGIGWGVAGVCPGPGILGSFLDGLKGFSWLAGFIPAYYLAGKI